MPNAESLRNPCCADNPARSNSPALVRLAIEDAPVVLREHGYQDAHRFPLVSPDVGRVRHSYRVAPSVAWTYPRLELRAGNGYPALSYDCDGREAVDRWRLWWERT